MVHLILFFGMTLSLVFLFVKHEQFKKLRERITDRRIMYDDLDKKKYFNLFWYKFFTCDYCCGFWCSIISFVCIMYFEPINYLFSAALASYLIFNIKEVWQ